MSKIASAVLWILKLLVKIILLPVVAVLTAAQLISIVAVSVSAWLFHLLGVVLIVMGFLSYGFALEPASEVWRMVGIGVAFCLVPEVGSWLILKITSVNILAIWLLRA